jgi:large subunit ribosomal protein L30
MAMLKITLTKSVISEVPKNRKTVAALGLGKTGRSVIQEDNSVIRGMVHQVKHLLRVETIEDTDKVRKRRNPKADSAEPVAAKPAKAKAAKAEANADEAVAPKKRATKKKENAE